MFSRFQYILNDYHEYGYPDFFYESFIKKHMEKGEELYQNSVTTSRENLEKFIFSNGHIDGTSLQKNWFSIEDVDVFLSHSHKDLSKVKAFAGWLYDNFNLTSFIDSCCWGYCDDLLREIDDEYCYNASSCAYSYELRNYSTSHVHMMLSSALSQMIDKTECVIFFNTPNSIILEDEISQINKGNKEATLSPWIYHELSMTTMIRQTIPTRFTLKTPILEHNSLNFSEEQRELGFEHDVSKYLKNMRTLKDTDLLEWQAHYISSKLTGEFALDTLYKMLKNKH